MRAPTDPVLQVRGVSVALGAVRVLDGVDVVVRPGAIVGVVGASGAGKSTLFRTIAGEVSPERGSILLGGEDVTLLPLWERARRGLGYVPQGQSVLLDLTVAQNIAAFEKAARAARNHAVRAEEVGLGEHLGVRARDLSGGERRRLEILRALIGDPAVLICDEPFAAGDPIYVRALSKLLREHAERGHAVLVADHRMRDVLELADEAIFLADGKVLVSGQAAALSDHPAVRGRYLGVT